jgi:hypothetical protein
MFVSGGDVALVMSSDGGEIRGILTKIDVLDYVANHCI